MREYTLCTKGQSVGFGKLCTVIFFHQNLIPTLCTLCTYCILAQTDLLTINDLSKEKINHYNSETLSAKQSKLSTSAVPQE